MKKLLMLLLITVIAMSSMFAFAEEEEKIFEENLITPYFVASCPLGEHHEMHVKGYTVIKDSDLDTIYTGIGYQCACGEVVVLRDGWWPNTAIGRYYTTYVGTDITGGAEITHQERSGLGYTSSMYLDGYMFMTH